MIFAEPISTTLYWLGFVSFTPHSFLLEIVANRLCREIGSAMYFDTSDPPQIVPNPSDTTGLWIYPRDNDTPVKVSIPEDCLGRSPHHIRTGYIQGVGWQETAFQTGEALSLLTSHRLSATPHFVSGRSSSTTLISRETFAFFLQPDVEDVIGENGETFGQFTKQVLKRHYLDGDNKKEKVVQVPLP